MMVEAGAKLLPEDVMAEAILFGHRALQPLIDLQEELQKPVGKPKRLPFLEPGHGLGPRLRGQGRRPAPSSSSSTSRPPATTPKMADLVEIAAVKVKGGKIADRWSTFVNPGRPIVGNQMHGITDKDVKGAPARRRPLARRSTSSATRRSSATSSASTSASSRPRSATGRGSSRAATSTR